ncbi:hypothetical protein [Microcella sp.]|uniref:hypothetical protein n=1 Tax=Microcella sp. TaxID=1913979 RepID=UPI003F6EC64B
MVALPQFSTSIAIATGFALVVGLSVMPGTESIAIAAPVEQVDVLLDSERQAPVVDAPEYEAPLPSMPVGDFEISAPVLLAEVPVEKGGGPRTQTQQDIESLGVEQLPVADRDEFSTTYEKPDGGMVTVIADVPQNIEVDGEFVEIETSARFEDGRWVVDPHPMSPSFAGSASGRVAEFSAGGYTV